MQLKQLRRLDSGALELSWGDGHSGPVTLQSLRDACPCAGCKGETVLLRSFTPAAPDTGVPGRYELRKAEMVGNYGMKFQWGDGHSDGIFTFEQLRRLCECPACQENKGDE